jgi:hypothetical protein
MCIGFFGCSPCIKLRCHDSCYSSVLYLLDIRVMDQIHSCTWLGVSCINEPNQSIEISRLATTSPSPRCNVTQHNPSPASKRLRAIILSSERQIRTRCSSRCTGRTVTCGSEHVCRRRVFHIASLYGLCLLWFRSIDIRPISPLYVNIRLTSSLNQSTFHRSEALHFSNGAESCVLCRHANLSP